MALNFFLILKYNYKTNKYLHIITNHIELVIISKDGIV